MSSIFILLVLYVQIFFATFFTASSGFLLRKKLINDEHYFNFLEDSFYGFILIGSLSLFLNFFFSLTQLLNTFFFIIILAFSISQGIFNKVNKKKILFYCAIVSIISFLLIIFSTVNRPDAWLYHLPYTKIINDSKIIIGISNIHERFAHISIFQYIASFYNNYFFFNNGILIPISLVTSFFFVYTFKEFRVSIKNKKLTLYSYVVFLILIFSLYSFNRYSEYGNDAQPHIFYYLFTIILLKSIILNHNQLYFKELSLISLFLFLMKPTFIFVSLIPLLIFLKQEKKLDHLTSIFGFFCVIIFFSWLLKNFLISGCFIYPLKFSCVKSITWFSHDLFNNILVNEAWSKNWPNFKNENNMQMSIYVKNLNWIKIWLNNHLPLILEKTLPVMIFLLFNGFIFKFFNLLEKKVLSKKIFYLFLFNLFFLITWFLKFPVYRLGISIIHLTLIFLIIVILLKNLKDDVFQKYSKYFNYFIISVMIIVLIKNNIKIYNNLNSHLIPNIYANKNLKDNTVKKYNSKGQFTHFAPINHELCGYYSSPCTHLNKDLSIGKKFGYQIFYKLDSNLDN